MWKTALQRRSAFSVLGLDEKTGHSKEEVKAAFCRRAKILHPDAGGNEELFRELYEAYGALRDSGATPATDCDEAPAGSSREACGVFYNDVNFRGSDDCFTGGGPGAAFARDGSSQGGSGLGAEWNTSHRVNNSTRDFYRPYTSNPFAHGFTVEEVQEAKWANRSRLGRLLLKHGLLWGCLSYFLFVYFREDRIRRAIEARDAGYSDATYWTRLQEDKIRGFSPAVQPHWMDTQNEQFVQDWNKGLQKRQMASMFGSGTYAARPRALTFQGRPFTSTGVRGAHTGVVKNYLTFEDDEHFEPEDTVEE